MLILCHCSIGLVSTGPRWNQDSQKWSWDQRDCCTAGLLVAGGGKSKTSEPRLCRSQICWVAHFPILIWSFCCPLWASPSSLVRHARGWGTLCSRHARRFWGSAEALHYHPVNHRPRGAGGGDKGAGGATGRWRDMQTGHLIPLPLADYRCPPCWQPHSQRSQARFRRPSATLPVFIHRVGAHSAASAHGKPPSYPSAVTPLGFNVYRASRKGCAHLLETCAQTHHPRGS